MSTHRKRATHTPRRNNPPVSPLLTAVSLGSASVPIRRYFKSLDPRDYTKPSDQQTVKHTLALEVVRADLLLVEMGTNILPRLLRFFGVYREELVSRLEYCFFGYSETQLKNSVAALSYVLDEVSAELMTDVCKALSLAEEKASPWQKASDLSPYPLSVLPFGAPGIAEDDDDDDDDDDEEDDDYEDDDDEGDDDYEDEDEDEDEEDEDDEQDYSMLGYVSPFALATSYARAIKDHQDFHTPEPELDFDKEFYGEAPAAHTVATNLAMIFVILRTLSTNNLPYANSAMLYDSRGGSTVSRYPESYRAVEVYDRIKAFSDSEETLSQSGLFLGCTFGLVDHILSRGITPFRSLGSPKEVSKQRSELHEIQEAAVKAAAAYDGTNSLDPEKHR
jgi:hypothetical protein